MLTKKQIIIGLSLIAIVIILRMMIDFSSSVDIAVMGVFWLLGCWFWYDNHREKENKNNK